MSARDALNAYVVHESDEDQAEFERRLDAFAAEVRAAALTEGAKLADQFTGRYESFEAMKAAGIIGPHTVARAIGAELRALAISGQRIPHPADCWCSGGGYTRWDATNSAWETAGCSRHVTTAAERLLVQPDGAEPGCTGSDDSTHDAGCPTTVRMATRTPGAES